MTGEESGVKLLKQEIKDKVEQIRQGIVPKGYKKTMLGIIPEDWEVNKLSEVSEVTMGQSPRSEFYNTEQKGLPLVQGNADIKNRRTYPRNYTTDITKTCLPDDIILSVRAPVGEISRSIHKACIGRGVCSIRAKGKFDSDYLFYFLIQNERKWKKLSQGSTFVAVNSQDIRDFPITSTSRLEQQKIADILSTWDRAIELKESLIKEKEEQKKGLMQELLTPVNSNQWFKLKLRDLGKTYNGLTGKTRKDFGTGKKFITFKNIFDNSKLNLNVFDRVLLKEGEKQNMIKYGDVFFTTSSETPHEVGMSSVLLDEIEEDIYLNSFCFGFRLNSFEEVLPEFLRYCLRGDSFRYEMMRLAQGSTRFNLSKTEFLKTTLEVPSISQQQRIAKILSTADQEIDLLKQEVEQLKKQKKGLMQLLLTGIVRVKEAVTGG